ncbi:hypothetical protein G4B88_000609 [Cannabis sativa]|uniref:Uncharacterized protein n=1 Tax=Cannabis sativa TaxID=3483 RepID=A0A7J6DZS6_CANSA|nr:hypothetical protein G4B88_000609 [Cannabis sativa]
MALGLGRIHEAASASSFSEKERPFLISKISSLLFNFKGNSCTVHLLPASFTTSLSPFLHVDHNSITYQSLTITYDDDGVEGDQSDDDSLPLIRDERCDGIGFITAMDSFCK